MSVETERAKMHQSWGYERALYEQPREQSPKLGGLYCILLYSLIFAFLSLRKSSYVHSCDSFQEV